MRFRVFVVTTGRLRAWAAHQAGPAVFGVNAVAPPPPAAPAPAAAPARRPAGRTASGAAGTQPMVRPASPMWPTVRVTTQPSGQRQCPHDRAGREPGAGRRCLPRDSLRPSNIPATPTPDGLTFTPGLVGDAGRGQKVVLGLGVHRLPHDQRQPELGRHHGPEPHARGLPVHDRGRTLSERHGTPAALDQERTGDEARRADADAGAQSNRPADRHESDGQAD